MWMGAEEPGDNELRRDDGAAEILRRVVKI